MLYEIINETEKRKKSKKFRMWDKWTLENWNEKKIMEKQIN